MGFMEETIKEAIPIWNKCLKTPFIQKLKNGNLAIDDFKNYIIQDSIYLKHYARMYGMAIYSSTTLKEIQMYYFILHFVTENESLIRLKYLQQFDLTDDDIELIPPLEENQKYINYMNSIVKHNNKHEIMMVLLPCMLSYSYIFRRIVKEEDISHNRYADFIRDYADDEYYAECKQLYFFANEMCQDISEQERKPLFLIFREASLMELDFWNMLQNKGGDNR